MAKKTTTSVPSEVIAEKNSPTAIIAPIEAILPDPNQPRRLLPHDLATQLAQGELSQLAALQAWLQRAENETAEAALRQNVRELKRLADSIAQHGLINPISVRLPNPNEPTLPGIIYFIVTGERRYWAHVYLLSQNRQIQMGQTSVSPEDIKLTLITPGISIRAHQLIENLLREDLNAIERARGMWALRYELSGVNYSSPPTGGSEVEADETNPTLSTPALVNDSSPPLVPWARVEETLGISKRYRIYITSVLNISEAGQALIAANNLAEMTIRPITQKLKNKPELQLKALEQLVAWQNNEDNEGPGQAIVTSVKEFVDKLLIDELIQTEAEPDTGVVKRLRSVSSAPVIRFRDKVRQTLDFLSRLKKNDRAELTQALQRGDYADVMLDLRILREQIDGILSGVPLNQVFENQISPQALLPSTTPEETDNSEAI